MNKATSGFVALLAVCGCGEEETQPLTRSQFCFQWGEAACSKETVSACQAASSDACVTAQQAFCLSIVPDEFVDQNTEACLEAVGRAYQDADLSGAELAVVLRLGAPCDALVLGPEPEGNACNSDNDCNTVVGVRCIFKAADTQGVCKVPERVDAGRSCTSAAAVCEDGFFCDGRNCIELNGEGAPCTHSRQCAASYFCAFSAATPDEGTCEKRFAVGAACLDDSQCASSFCDDFSPELTCTDRVRLARAEPLCDYLGN